MLTGNPWAECTPSRIGNHLRLPKTQVTGHAGDDAVAPAGLAEAVMRRHAARPAAVS